MKYTVSGLGAVQDGFKAIDVDVRTMRKELRPAVKTLRTALRSETPARSGDLRKTARGQVSRFRISASVGSKNFNYANWNQWGKKSPNKRFGYAALYSAIKPIELEIGSGIQRIINKHM